MDNKKQVYLRRHVGRGTDADGIDGIARTSISRPARPRPARSGAEDRRAPVRPSVVDLSQSSGLR